MPLKPFAALGLLVILAACTETQGRTTRFPPSTRPRLRAMWRAMAPFQWSCAAVHLPRRLRPRRSATRWRCPGLREAAGLSRTRRPSRAPDFALSSFSIPRTRALVSARCVAISAALRRRRQTAQSTSAPLFAGPTNRLPMPQCGVPPARFRPTILPSGPFLMAQSSGPCRSSAASGRRFVERLFVQHHRQKTRRDPLERAQLTLTNQFLPAFRLFHSVGPGRGIQQSQTRHPVRRAAYHFERHVAAHRQPGERKPRRRFRQHRVRHRRH